MKAVFKYIITLFCCLIVVCLLHAQDPWIDSVKNFITTAKADSNRVKALNTLVGAYRFSYPDSGLIWAKQAVALSKKLNNDTLTFWSLVSVCGCLYPLGNFSDELNYALEIQLLVKKLNMAYARGYANGIMSDAYLNFGEYKTSLAYWRKVVDICEYELPGELTSVYGNSAMLFARANQYDSSLKYAEKAYRAFHNDTAWNNDSSAIKIFCSNIFETWGEAFAGKQQYDSALHYYHTSIHYSESIDMRLTKIDACNGIAEIYSKKGYTDSAIAYCEKVLAIDGASKRYPISVLKTVTLLASLYEANKEPDSSLKYMHLASDIKDSVYSREKTSAFQNILFKENEKENEVAIATEKLKNQYRMYFLIATFVVVPQWLRWFGIMVGFGLALVGIFPLGYAIFVDNIILHIPVPSDEVIQKIPVDTPANVFLHQIIWIGSFMGVLTLPIWTILIGVRLLRKKTFSLNSSY